MKPWNIFLYSCIFVGLSLFAFTLVFHSMTDRSLVDISKWFRDASNQQNASFIAGKCSDREPISGLELAQDPHLRKLNEYQQVCGSFVTDQLMVFTEMPNSAVEAQDSAKKMAETLKEFQRFNVSPLVVVEPVTGWGLVDFQEFGTGFYDKWIKQYFSTLKSEGISDDMMGTWVPFPEANLPYWNHANATPKDFSAIVNRYLGSLKAEFPSAHASILLNSATYENDDFDWSNGEYVSLVQYVSGIQKGLVDSFGIQGFPWMPPAGEHQLGVFDAREYLNARLAMEAADTLGVRSIWFNTGSFSKKYTMDAASTVEIDPGKRKDILNGILTEVSTAKQKGYSVKINLFSEDKSALAEATDWSYWKNTSDVLNLNRSVFVDFIVKAKDMDIPVSLFDILHE